MNIVLKSLGMSLLLAATAAFAHHGWSEYDSSKPLQLSGTIEQSGYSHPHGFVNLKTPEKTWNVVLAPPSRGQIKVLTGGYAELGQYIKNGQIRVLAIGAPERVPQIDAPTLKESGYDVIIGNWRGVYGAANLTPEQRKEVTDAVLAASKSNVWQDNIRTNAWTESVLTGDDFGKFVEEEHVRLRAMLVKVGLL